MQGFCLLEFTKQRKHEKIKAEGKIKKCYSVLGLFCARSVNLCLFSSPNIRICIFYSDFNQKWEWPKSEGFLLVAFNTLLHE